MVSCAHPSHFPVCVYPRVCPLCWNSDLFQTKKGATLRGPSRQGTAGLPHPLSLFTFPGRPLASYEIGCFSWPLPWDWISPCGRRGLFWFEEETLDRSQKEQCDYVFRFRVLPWRPCLATFQLGDVEEITGTLQAFFSLSEKLGTKLVPPLWDSWKINWVIPSQTCLGQCFLYSQCSILSALFIGSTVHGM